MISSAYSSTIKMSTQIDGLYLVALMSVSGMEVGPQEHLNIIDKTLKKRVK